MPLPPLRHGQPIWLERDRPNAQRVYPPLRGHLEVDVAIVGGGITGSVIAAAFASAGVRVGLVEAARLGRGSTAASSALLLQDPDQGLGELSLRYGPRAGRRIWELTHEAARGLLTTLRKHRVSCDLVERDSVYYTRSPETMRSLRAEFERRSRAGFAGEWLTSGALRRLTGLTGRGAIRTSGNAQTDPYKASLGLIRAAIKSGAEVFEHSAVRRIDRVRDRVRLRTAAGTIDAGQVVVATGYATPQFRPLAGRFRLQRTYVLATRPMDAGQRRELGLANVMIWDTERPYHYARWTTDHRLLLGGGDRPLRPGAKRSAVFAKATRELREDFEALFPTLADVGIDRAWEGLFATTPDSLPYIGAHRAYPGHVFALGYGGNGMTFASLAARLLLERWQGVRSTDHGLFGFARIR